MKTFESLQGIRTFSPPSLHNCRPKMVRGAGARGGRRGSRGVKGSTTPIFEKRGGQEYFLTPLFSGD